MKYRFSFLIGLLILPGIALNAQAQDDHDHDKPAVATSPAQSVDQHDDHEDHDEHGNEEAHDEYAGHDEGESDLVVLTEAEIAEFGVVLDTAGPGRIRSEIVVPGEIAVNGDRIAHIFPRFTGVVKQVFKRIGDRVRTGDVLAVVESNEGLTPYNVTALMDGTVIDKEINVGEVHQGDRPAFIIADLDTVWVNLSIYQMHLAEVQTGQTAAITADHGINHVNGLISYVSPVVDEHTRTSIARVVLANPTGKWRPGLLIEGRIATDFYSAAVVVPKSAIFHMEDAEVVFVQTPDGFRSQPVTIGRTNHANAEIVSGLEAGQAYAAFGGFTIKAEMQKGSFGDGHAH
ncbi:MAG: HlyD family efflux transporter periplasmic adaptor subunit [Candidatus Abyssobacteria bacterium SURF_17]|uniref:HlyD family efflux transporter periplasmic adaptor subunit n=1 Tax=Candidatus Abyssobacteria bacterium SURF_17 TaxID=2093361 RepID=A0A419EYW8_9BACT|nr:MAG: HlyD family efflux transporter periplasmic adaptor subunit [Candidatus Abyssubacteria bacterium SURF_17]